MDISKTVGVNGPEKCTHNEINWVLSVKESNFNEKISIFTFAYGQGRGG